MGKAVTRPLSASALATAVGAELIGDGDFIIQSVASLDAAVAGDLSFLSDPKFRAAAQNSPASVLIVRAGDMAVSVGTRLVHPAPHLAFARALELLFADDPMIAAVSPQAVVHPSATHDGCRIEALAQVGAGSALGSGTRVGAGAVIGRGVRVGRDCIIHANATLYDGVQLGDRCIVHSGAVIGSDGFGFQPGKAGWHKVPQVGSVVVGNDVEVGANSCIDRGAIEDTVIGNGVKIDNLVQIAHNCRIGDHTAIAGCVGMAGSTLIGSRCMIGGAAMLAGHLSICDDVVISGGTLVATSITAPGRYTGVFPMTSHRDWARIAVGLRRSAG